MSLMVSNNILTASTRRYALHPLPISPRDSRQALSTPGCIFPAQKTRPLPDGVLQSPANWICQNSFGILRCVFHHILCKLCDKSSLICPLMLSVRDAISDIHGCGSYSSCTGRNSVSLNQGCRQLIHPGISIIVSMAAGSLTLRLVK